MKFGILSTVPGLGFSGSPKVFGRMKVANGKKKFGRILFRSVESSSDFKVWVDARGSLSVVTAMRVEFTIGWRRMIAFREGSFSLKCTSVQFRSGGLRPVR